MQCFLTSNLIDPNTGEINPANCFIDNLRACLPDPCDCVFLSSDPMDHNRTDYFAGAVKKSLCSAGFTLRQFHILDSRNQEKAADLVNGANLLILAGGHVPTQNRFFNEIHLKELLHSFQGVLVGISAGSMNCAEVVYAHPELDGEAADPHFQKYLPGLGLTNKMILPHYQMIKDDILDGLRVMEDIAYPDSQGRAFYALVDGSYLHIDNGTEKIYGQAYIIADGNISQISSLRDIVTVSPQISEATDL